MNAFRMDRSDLIDLIQYSHHWLPVEFACRRRLSFIKGPQQTNWSIKVSWITELICVNRSLAHRFARSIEQWKFPRNIVCLFAFFLHLIDWLLSLQKTIIIHQRFSTSKLFDKGELNYWSAALVWFVLIARSSIWSFDRAVKIPAKHWTLPFQRLFLQPFDLRLSLQKALVILSKFLNKQVEWSRWVDWSIIVWFELNLLDRALKIPANCFALAFWTFIPTIEWFASFLADCDLSNLSGSLTNKLRDQGELLPIDRSNYVFSETLN